MRELTKPQRSLLLYLESVCVDQSGLIEDARMNNEDWNIFNAWQKEDFIETRLRADCRQRGRNHAVRLSEEAWQLAHAIRRQRADNPLAREAWGDEPGTGN